MQVKTCGAILKEISGFVRKNYEIKKKEESKEEEKEQLYLEKEIKIYY